MKKLYFLILFCFLFPVVYSQSSSELYVITAHPFRDPEEQFGAVLWKYGSDTLTKQLTLATEDEEVLSIKLYPEFGYFTLIKGNTWKQELSYDSLLIYNLHTNVLDRYLICSQDFSMARLSNNFLIKDTNNRYIIAMKLIKIEEPVEIKHVGMGLYNKQLIDSLPLQAYRTVYLTGYPGGEVDGRDYIIACSREDDGFLEIVVSGDRSQRPCFPYELPEAYRFHTYARQFVGINNGDYFVVGGEKQSLVNELGSRGLYIYDKKSSQWYKKKLKGNLPRVQGFCDWLCGYVGDDSESLLNKPLPGSSLWKDRATGLSPEIRYRGMYAPGILYFYNPATDVYFELETGQADSEVVLIQGDKVLYRIYDELYETDLIDGTKLGKSKLLLKDDRVPDIHWAFYKDNSNK